MLCASAQLTRFDTYMVLTFKFWAFSPSISTTFQVNSHVIIFVMSYFGFLVPGGPVNMVLDVAFRFDSISTR